MLCQLSPKFRSSFKNEILLYRGVIGTVCGDRNPQPQTLDVRDEPTTVPKGD